MANHGTMVAHQELPGDVSPEELAAARASCAEMLTTAATDQEKPYTLGPIRWTLTCTALAEYTEPSS